MPSTDKWPDLSQGAMWVHKKSKTTYMVITKAQMEATGQNVVVYRDLRQIHTWVRPESEFLEKFVPQGETLE